MINDVVIVGGGPAGLSAAISASESSKNVLLIERDEKLGGILKQCIHDGFGLETFNDRLTGPEYAQKYIEMLGDTNVEVWTKSFVTKISKENDLFSIDVITRDGIKNVKSKTVIVSTGCRERTQKQIFIHGTRPAGIFTAGCAQYYVNVLGKLPTKNCAILGSGDIGLIMARRLVLEGVNVIGVYEIKSEPSGLQRNISQCLNDFNIPLHLSTTVTRVFGRDRLTHIEIAKVDEHMNVIKGTEEIVECDSLIVSCGLIPENELLDSLNVPMSKVTRGPIVDQTSMTLVDGLYSCGNSLHVNDLVDYVSLSSKEVGLNAALYKNKKRTIINVNTSEYLSYTVPEVIDIEKNLTNLQFFFRSKEVLKDKTLRVLVNENEIFKKKYMVIRPAEMEKIIVDFSDSKLDESSKIDFVLE